MLNFNNNTLYKEIIMDHYKRPLNKGLKDNLKVYTIKNPVCGDFISLQAEVKDGKIKNIFHEGVGCSISMSSVSVMSDLLKNKTISEAVKYINNYVSMISGEGYNKGIDFKDAIAYATIKDYPARFKCASISWELLLNILNTSTAKQK